MYDTNIKKHEHKLWYKKPADDWLEALPLGNGRLGGMVYGKITREQVQLNQDSIWYGHPVDRNNPDALKNLPKIRELLFAGKISEAEALSVMALSGIPESQRPYQTMGDLFLQFPLQEERVTHYKRCLDLDKSLLTVQFKENSITYKREYFTSAPDQVMVIRLTADQSKAISLKALLRRNRFMDEVKAENNQLIMFAGGGHDQAVQYCTALGAVTTGGTMQTIGEHLVVENADEVILVLAAATSFYDQDYKQACKKLLSAALDKPFQTLLTNHINDYQALYNRLSLKIKPAATEPDLAGLDTAERLNRLQASSDMSDNELMSLYFQYGRYLLISCSRPGSLPANLQGIWNQDMLPAWDSKYTININTEMNYWPAESCNLSECHQPLFDHLERMLKPGSKTAKTMYGCRGFVAHHNTDIWGDTAPQDLYVPATYWPMGAAWLSLHIWEHYCYTLDLDFLTRYYPIMKEAALFFLDYLVEDPQGRLVTCPSVSPENTYKLPNGEQGRLCYGPAMDSQILALLFQSCSQADALLKDDADFINQLIEAAQKLPEPSIGRYGQIMEWLEDYEEIEPGHRHISHLFGLYPGNLFSIETTPELAEAARKTLERRLSHGGGHTGWSRAWIINMWARLQDQEQAYDNLLALLRKSTQPNLFDSHPPFQIDGNFGGLAGMVEMLMQCHDDVILFLPALPAAWPEGQISGLKARQGFIVSFSWQEGQLQTASIEATKDNRCILKLPDSFAVYDDGKPVDYEINKQDEHLSFAAKAGHVYSIAAIR